jgi:hypothetical protein
LGNLASNCKHSFGAFTPSPTLWIVLLDISIKSYVKCIKNITTAFSDALCHGNHGLERNMESLFDYCTVIQPSQGNVNMIT